jgi:hypothetical protein
MKFLFTVSPVPLMATATAQQVVVASSYSKSVLRAVAGQLAEQHHDVDYFPSYEIISSPMMRGGFFEADGRSVISQGVDHVMAQFFSQHPPPVEADANAAAQAQPEADDLVCDEVLLDVFGSET